MVSGSSHRHRCADRRVVLVVHELKVLIAVVEQARRAAFDREPWQRQWRARELQIRLLEMIEVQVAVAPGPYELARLEIALLREQVGEERIARDVERHAEKEVGAALVELAGEPSAGDIELEERVAG